MLFLVEGEVERTDYMQDGSVKEQKIRLVEAKDVEDAEYKFKQFFEEESSPYSHTFYVNNVEAHPVIV